MKFILSIIIFLCGIASANSQDITSHNFTQLAKVRFGAKIGFNIANTDFNRGYPKPAVPVATTWRSGFVAGFLMQVPLGPKLSLQQEYLYAQMGGRIASSGTEYSFNYLSLPLLVNYALLPRLAIMAGPQFDLLLTANQRISNVSEDITHNTEERSVGATAGLEFYLLKSLSLTGRYLYGLNHIGLEQRTAATEFKFESVQVTADIKF